MNAAFYEKVPRRPSEYMHHNVFFGASFASPYEVEQAAVEGFSTQLMWGSDYPHVEGTFLYPDGTDMPSVTRLSLRNTFCEIPIEETRRMIADNAVTSTTSTEPAWRRSPPPSPRPRADDLRTPIDAVPEGAELPRLPLGVPRMELTTHMDEGAP